MKNTTLLKQPLYYSKKGMKMVILKNGGIKER
jgi:hypothetical protein